MIRMEQPSFCFNSVDISWPGYQMWKTVTGWEGITPIQLAAEVMSANLLSIGTFGCSLRNIILNSHGFSAGILAACITMTTSQVASKKNPCTKRTVPTRHIGKPYLQLAA
jgi:hypothetical protein